MCIVLPDIDVLFDLWRRKYAGCGTILCPKVKMKALLAIDCHKYTPLMEQAPLRSSLVMYC